MSRFINEYDFLLSSDDECETSVTTLIVEDLANTEEEPHTQATHVHHRQFIRRNFLAGHQRIFDDYFSEKPVYTPYLFRKRFRMNKDLFLRILNAVENYEPFFVQRRNNAGMLGLSALQKITAAFRILAYGVGADVTDEYVRIGETSAIKSMKLFCKAVISIFGEEYLRSPNNTDIARLLSIGEQQGFPGMLGSIDYMHWKWKNCPTSWRGLTDGHAPEVNYTINGNEYIMGYYLADGIYPSWSTFVKMIPAPLGNKQKLFASTQEFTRNDVERAFGVLQARFAIVRGPARYFNQSTLKDIMMACIILHNMIVEDERDTYLRARDFEYDHMEGNNPVIFSRNSTSEFTDFRRRRRIIRDRENHSQLQTDLVEHQWMLHSQR